MSNEHPRSPAGTEGLENQITVVIPAYNEEESIQETVQVLLALAPQFKAAGRGYANHLGKIRRDPYVRRRWPGSGSGS